LCLVASPWAKRGAVVSKFCNQTSVLRTMELILGLPPLSQQDAAAVPLDACFTDQPDLEPFTALANRIALDERNPKQTASQVQDLSQPDRIDDDAFNRVIWHSVRGDERYPEGFAGAHGKGLGRLGLHLAAGDEGDED
jgi:hypothetical protein